MKGYLNPHGEFSLNLPARQIVKTDSRGNLFNFEYGCDGGYNFSRYIMANGCFNISLEKCHSVSVPSVITNTEQRRDNRPP